MEQTTRGEHDRAKITELFQGLLLLALEKDATIASLGTSSASMSLSDNGRGWTRRAFETRFPARDLGRRLQELGCVEVQIISKSRRIGLTTGRLRPDQLLGCPLKGAESPSTGTVVAFTLAQPVDSLQEILQVARGTLSLRVGLNLKDIPPLHLVTALPLLWGRAVNTSAIAPRRAPWPPHPGRDGRAAQRPARDHAGTAPSCAIRGPPDRRQRADVPVRSTHGRCRQGGGIRLICPASR